MKLGHITLTNSPVGKGNSSNNIITIFQNNHSILEQKKSDKGQD